MHRLGTYLPEDRLRALLRGDSLPSQTHGTAIFADIPGSLAECLEKLPEQVFQTAWQAGINMEFEQAVKFALEN